MTLSKLPTTNPSPRGRRRAIYASDTCSIALNYLPDPVSEADLRSWVDDLADAGADTLIQDAYAQGWTIYWRTDRFDYDARPQHRRFLSLLDSGVQPLQVLLDHSHERGMEFMAGMRVNDDHAHISIAQGVGAGSSFITGNPKFHIEETAGKLDRKISTPLDFTFPEVHEYVASVAEHLLESFDLDGIELAFRDKAYFPAGTERERQPHMTEFVRRVSDIVSRAGQARGRKLTLGVRVLARLELNRSKGLDVATWIKEGLVDYVAPSDIMYTAINEPMEEFGELTRETDCMLYPGIMPHSSARRIRFLNSQPLNLDQKRAVAQNFYAAGADGLSYYNHMWAIPWAPFYPMSLYEMGELRDPERVARGARHYVFEPILAGQAIWEAGLSTLGRPEPERIVLNRSVPCPSGEFRFRICEDLESVRHASLLFRAYNMTPGDSVEVGLNGQVIAPRQLRFHVPENFSSGPVTNIADYEKRIDEKAGADKSSHRTAGLSPVPMVPESFMTGWFRLTSPPGMFGDNTLGVTLTSGDPEASDDIVIEEIEVHVAP